ncbi:VCBS domain-containing protein [Bradyrhizobium sp. URHA0013]|uniref:beta strand repeat-containing protein n=1 Tax=Bradyrhizobium sp. URHA0013 TaxID=1380352 RepID=UPI0004B6EBA3|nr:VCBS domain-containing protein [Bradyrhizobium sp. URHA0013]
MTNHTPIFTSSSATGSFTEFANLNDSTTLHTLSGTMSFKDSDKIDTHTTAATLHSAVLSSGTIIPAASLAHFQAAMHSQILSDSNGNGQLKWSFSDQDQDFDFLSKNQTLVLTYDVKVSDNHGGFAIQTVKITITGTDDKPVINMGTVATVTEQANQTLSLSPDTVHVALNFTDDDLTNTGHTATVIGVSASGATAGLLPGSLGDAELMAFYHVDNVVKTSGSSTGTINTTFAAPDLAFDYLAAGQHLDITYTVQLDDHAGGISTQTVKVTVVGSNDKPIFLSCPESAALVEDHNVDPTGNLTAHDSLVFADIDLADAHSVSTTVTATRSGGGSIPLTNAQLLAAFGTALQDSTGHVIGEVDWNFAFPNSSTNFLNGGETLKLVYHVAVDDGHGGSTTQDVTITILGTNHPVVITSGPESSTVAEQDATTGSAVPDTTPTTPAGTLAFTDQDTSDTHAVTVTLGATSGPTPPATTQADLAAALTTTLHDSTGTGTGSIDWNFAIADKDLDYLAFNETLTVNYDIKVADGSTSSTQTVSVVITGANDAVAMTSGPQSASLSEQPGQANSSTPDTTAVQTLNFADVDLADVHSVDVSLTSAVWSADPSFVPGETLNALQSALTTVLHDSTGFGTGGIDWSFSLPDQDLDFLGISDTLTVIYDITVTDGTTTSTQHVTITATGAADPVIVNPVTATINDSSSTDAGSFVAVGNAIHDVADSPGDGGLSLSITAVNGQAANVGTSIAAAYGSLLVASDGTYHYTASPALDQLQLGDNATEQFTITVTNSLGESHDTTLTFNVFGADDAPMITAANSVGTLTEDAGPAVIVNGGFEAGNLSGWTAVGAFANHLLLGGQYGDYSALLSDGFLEQNVATVAGQHYTLSFEVAGDAEATSSSFSVFWDGVQIHGATQEALGFTKFTFDVVGDGGGGSTPLQFNFSTDGAGQLLDAVSVSPTPGPAVETTGGSISFSDAEAADTHTASFTAQDGGYVGTFSLDPVSEVPGSGSIAWHYTVDNADIQFLAQGQTLVQTYAVTILDSNGASSNVQNISVAINGTNDAPTAVSETVITDVGANGSVVIPGWALALNDTDPDTTDHLGLGGIAASSGGSAGPGPGFAFFTDDATPGGSFSYAASDGTTTSSNTATATVINSAANATTLTGTGGDDVLIATNGTETMSGGGGNDVLIAAGSGNVMTGGGGNDTFAFLQPSGPSVVSDFNNITEHDHIAVSANGFGGGLAAGVDVTFETSGDNVFSGFSQFHFDTGNQTLYYSADGTDGAAIAVVSVQSGVMLNQHDILVV